MRHALFPLVLALLPPTLAIATPAAAQLVLPGAVAPTPEGAPGTSPPPPARRAPRPRPVQAIGPSIPPAAPARVLPAAALAGQTLYRDGRDSQVTFALQGKELAVSRLTLSGRAEDGAECRVDVADLPLTVRDEGQPDGMARIGIPVPTCPISFDVLDGAVLATGDSPRCEVKAAHCRVDLAGLWGPPPATLTPERDKAIERERARAEGGVRAGFKRLLATTKDRPTIMGYAREQAQFSSTREELCRGYAGELKHGFCATRLTEARAATLGAKAEAGQAEKDKRRKKSTAGRG